MSDCICIKSGTGPEGCGICNETGSRLTDHAELARLDEAATPGPWYLRTNRHTATNGNQWGWLDSCPPGARQLAPEGVAVTWEEGRQSHSNARFIAAANPARFLALLAEIAALRTGRDDLKRQRDEAVGLVGLIVGDAFDCNEDSCLVSHRMIGDARTFLASMEPKT
jgi:hypothetical protein